MPTITPRTLIYDAYRSLGVLRPGQAASDDGMDDALRALNDLLDSWQIEHLMVYAVNGTTYPLVAGTASYTLGPGGTLSPTNPVKVEGAGLMRSGVTCETPVPVLTAAQYRGCSQHGVYIDGAVPVSTLTVRPAPTGDESLVLYTWAPFTAFAHLDEAINFPAGYARALRWNLALELVPYAAIMTKIPNAALALVQAQSDASKGWVKSFHSSPPPEMSMPAGLGCGCAYDISSDTYR